MKSNGNGEKRLLNTIFIFLQQKSLKVVISVAY